MKRVLVIDDDVQVVNEIEGVLAADGLDVDKALSGEEGLRLARKKLPSLMLIDLVMPGTSGFQVCKNIKNEPELEGTPIIMLTLREGAFDPRYTKLFGVVDFLKKPLDADLLREKVWNALGESPGEGADAGDEPSESAPGGPEEAETVAPLDEYSEEGLGGEEFSEAADGAMFSSMDDISGIPLGPDESLEGGFQSPIRFDDLEESPEQEPDLELQHPDEELYRPRSEYDAFPEEEEPAPAFPLAEETEMTAFASDAVEIPAGEPEAEREPELALEHPEDAEITEPWAQEEPFSTEAPGAQDSGGEGEPGIAGVEEDRIGGAEEPADTAAAAGTEAGESRTSEEMSPEIASLLRETLDREVPAAIRDAVGVESVGKDVAAGLMSSLDAGLRESVRQMIETEMRAVRESVGGGIAPGMLDERISAALDRFREEFLPGLLREGIQSLKGEVRATLEAETSRVLGDLRDESLPEILRGGMQSLGTELGTTIEQTVFRATEEFLSGRFEDIVAERIGAVLQGTGARTGDKGAAFEGDLGSLALRTVLGMLETQGATGWLSVVGAEYIVDIHVKDGHIRFASSLAAPMETRLGRILLEKNLVDEDTLIVARQEGRRRGKRLGRVLVELGKLSQHDLGETLCEQTRRLTGHVLSAASGRFLFAPGDLDPEIEGLPCSLSVSEIDAGP